MFDRLNQIEARYEELTQALSSPDIVNDSAKFQKTAKAHSEISPIVERYREYKDLKKGIAESRAMLVDEKDPEMRAYAQEELDKLEARVAAVEAELKVLLLPKDPNDEKTSSWKFVLAPAETKLPCSLPKCSVCIHAMRKRKVGKWKCSPLPNRLSAD